MKISPTLLLLLSFGVGLGTAFPIVRVIPPPISLIQITDNVRHYVQTCRLITLVVSGNIALRPSIVEFDEPCVADTIFYNGFETAL